MSETTLYSQTIIPGEGNDTITIPRRFYGRPLTVSFACAPVPVDVPVPATTPPPSTLPDIPESLRKRLPKFTKEQIEALGNSPRIKELSALFKGTGLPPDITMKEIREMRLKEKYG